MATEEAFIKALTMTCSLQYFLNTSPGLFSARNHLQAHPNLPEPDFIVELFGAFQIPE